MLVNLISPKNNTITAQCSSNPHSYEMERGKKTFLPLLITLRSWIRIF
jgi:hypothetical protein